MPNLRSALVSPGGVLRVNNASYNAVLVRLHTAFHSVSCNDVQRRKQLHHSLLTSFPDLQLLPCCQRTRWCGQGRTFPAQLQQAKV
jgi:hypothetical protein